MGRIRDQNELYNPRSLTRMKVGINPPLKNIVKVTRYITKFLPSRSLLDRA
ncbi:hypothetical protein D3C86_2171030 [compost metagenome]